MLRPRCWEPLKTVSFGRIATEGIDFYSHKDIFEPKGTPIHEVSRKGEKSGDNKVNDGTWYSEYDAQSMNSCTWRSTINITHTLFSSVWTYNSTDRWTRVFASVDRRSEFLSSIESPCECSEWLPLLPAIKSIEKTRAIFILHRPFQHLRCFVYFSLRIELLAGFVGHLRIRSKEETRSQATSAPTNRQIQWEFRYPWRKDAPQSNRNEFHLRLALLMFQ